MKRFFVGLIALLVAGAVSAQNYPSPTYNNLTLNGNINLPSKDASRFFASPSGSPGSPTFRAIAPADVPALPMSNVTGLQAALDAKVDKSALAINVLDYGASGSKLGTNGSITNGSASLTVTSAIDFKVGQGIRIVGAGAALTATQPTGFTATQNGTTGAVTYQYALSVMNCAGGLGVPVTASIANGNATLSRINNISLSFTASGNCGVAVWRKIGAGAYVYAGVTTQNAYTDTGWVPAWRPQNIDALPPASARAQDLITKINAINGTTLTLANAASATVSGSYVTHDDTAAFKAAIAYASLNPVGNRADPGGDIRVPCGTFNLTSALRVTTGNVGLTGSGECSVLQPFHSLNLAEFEGGGPSSFIFGNWFENFYVPAYNQFNGNSLYVAYAGTFTNRRVYYDHPYNGQTFRDVNDVRLHNIRSNNIWGYGTTGLNIESGPAAGEYACCFDISDWYTNNLATSATMGGGRFNSVGVRIDGNVATVLARALAVSNVEGNGFAIGNSVGNAQPPSFIQIGDGGTEFSTGRGISVDAGQEIMFVNTIVHGAGFGNPNVYTGPNVKDFSWIGGRVGNAGGDGFSIAGQNTRITGASIINNSATNRGGTTATRFGIVLESTALGATIAGNYIGVQYGVGWAQNQPVFAVTGADYYSVTGNVFRGNNSNAPGCGTLSGSKVCANNAQ